MAFERLKSRLPMYDEVIWVTMPVCIWHARRITAIGCTMMEVSLLNGHPDHIVGSQEAMESGASRDGLALVARR